MSEGPGLQAWCSHFDTSRSKLTSNSIVQILVLISYNLQAIQAPVSKDLSEDAHVDLIRLKQATQSELLTHLFAVTGSELDRAKNADADLCSATLAPAAPVFAPGCLDIRVTSIGQVLWLSLGGQVNVRQRHARVALKFCLRVYQELEQSPRTYEIGLFDQFSARTVRTAALAAQEDPTMQPGSEGLRFQA